MSMIKTYIIKIQSRNLTHDHRRLAVQKVFFQMILKNKDHQVKNDPSSSSNFLNLNRDRNRLQKYWAIVTKPCRPLFTASPFKWRSNLKKSLIILNHRNPQLKFQVNLSRLCEIHGSQIWFRFSNSQMRALKHWDGHLMRYQQNTGAGTITFLSTWGPFFTPFII